MKREEIRKGLEILLEGTKHLASFWEEELKRNINSIKDCEIVYLYGIRNGFSAIHLLKRYLPNSKYVFVDRFPRVLRDYNQIQCISPDELYVRATKKDVVLVLADKSREEIARCLREKQSSSEMSECAIVKDFGILFCNTDYDDLYPNEIYKEYWENRDEILRVYDLLEDVESCYVYSKVILNRIMNRNDWVSIYTPVQYFINEIRMLMNDQEVFLDCGAFTGDTLEDFRKYSNDRFTQAYEFELDKDNYERLCTNPMAQDDRVAVFNMGVGSDDQEIEFSVRTDSPGQNGFAFMNHNDMLGAEKRIGRICAIDAMISRGKIRPDISFVKMDIEGAELSALNGMGELIKDKKPKLAICLYHRSRDLWEIPNFIRELCPEYHFLVRHHDHRSASETVLYAYIV